MSLPLFCMEYEMGAHLFKLKNKTTKFIIIISSLSSTVLFKSPPLLKAPTTPPFSLVFCSPLIYQLCLPPSPASFANILNYII